MSFMCLNYLFIVESLTPYTPSQTHSDRVSHLMVVTEGYVSGCMGREGRCQYALWPIQGDTQYSLYTITQCALR